MEVATIVTALAALVTGLASFFMVLEMKRQRTAISRPVLKLLSKYCQAHTVGESFWAWEGENSYSPRLRFLNFGTGPALNVSLEWVLNEDELIKSLKHFDSYNQFEIERKGNLIQLDKSFHNIENQKSHKIEAVPVYDGKDNTSLDIPSYYVAGFETFIKFAFLSRPKHEENIGKSFNLPGFPSIKLIASYEDINGNKSKQIFNVELRLQAIVIGKQDEKTNISASFEVGEEGV